MTKNISTFVNDETKEKIDFLYKIKRAEYRDKHEFYNEIIRNYIKENEHLFPSFRKRAIEKKETENINKESQQVVSEEKEKQPEEKIEQIKESEKKEEQTEEKDTPTITKGNLILLDIKEE